MKAMSIDRFWDDCDLVSRDPEIISGAPVLRGTRLPADTLVSNVEGFMELEGQSLDEAVNSTLQSFPSTPGGAATIYTLLAYQHAHVLALSR